MNGMLDDIAYDLAAGMTPDEISETYDRKLDSIAALARRHGRRELARVFTRAATTERRQRRRAEGLTEDDPRHGTGTGYRDYGCRCDPCRDAVARESRDYYWSRKAA